MGLIESHQKCGMESMIQELDTTLVFYSVEKSRPEEMNMSKYNRESVEKEIKKSGVSAKEASLTHRLLKGHRVVRYKSQEDELDQEPWESKTDYCGRMGFDM